MPRKSSSSPSTLRRRSTSTTRRGKRIVRRRTTNNSTTRNRRGNSSTSSRRVGSSGSSSSSSSSALSARTRKAIDTLPSHAQKIYTKAHKNALKQYASPSKRRGGKRQSKEQVAHKVAWSAVKKEYKKKGDKWVPKKD
ncbi:MAG TPA: ChaB family protein [Nitrososphaera sp.]